MTCFHRLSKVIVTVLGISLDHGTLLVKYQLRIAYDTVVVHTELWFVFGQAPLDFAYPSPRPAVAGLECLSHIVYGIFLRTDIVGWRLANAGHVRDELTLVVHVAFQVWYQAGRQVVLHWLLFLNFEVISRVKLNIPCLAVDNFVGVLLWEPVRVLNGVVLIWVAAAWSWDVVSSNWALLKVLQRVVVVDTLKSLAAYSLLIDLHKFLEISCEIRLWLIHFYRFQIWPRAVLLIFQGYLAFCHGGAIIERLKFHLFRASHAHGLVRELRHWHPIVVCINVGLRVERLGDLTCLYGFIFPLKLGFWQSLLLYMKFRAPVRWIGCVHNITQRKLFVGLVLVVECVRAWKIRLGRYSGAPLFDRYMVSWVLPTSMGSRRLDIWASVLIALVDIYRVVHVDILLERVIV